MSISPRRRWRRQRRSSSRRRLKPPSTRIPADAPPPPKRKGDGRCGGHRTDPDATREAASRPKGDPRRRHPQVVKPRHHRHAAAAGCARAGTPPSPPPAEQKQPERVRKVVHRFRFRRLHRAHGHASGLTPRYDRPASPPPPARLCYGLEDLGIPPAPAHQPCGHVRSSGYGRPPSRQRLTPLGSAAGLRQAASEPRLVMMIRRNKAPPALPPPPLAPVKIVGGPRSMSAPDLALEGGRLPVGAKASGAGLRPIALHRFRQSVRCEIEFRSPRARRSGGAHLQPF